MSPSRLSNRRTLLSALFIATLFALVGCSGGGSSGPKDVIKGKVTIDKKPVSGTVVFVGSDNKEIQSPIAANGDYIIPNPPKGEGYFLVKGSIGIIAPTHKEKEGSKGKDSKTEVKGAEAGGGEAPPEKYSKKDNGLPKVDFKGGELIQNLELAP